MKEIPLLSTRAGLRRYLVVGYALFIVYASLTPFSGWQEQGLEFFAVLSAPLTQTYTLFDVIINLLAYLPLGLLLGLTLRTRLAPGWNVLLAVLVSMLLSAAMEYAQMYLPVRTSSNLDVLSNTLGALVGALLALSIAPSAWFALHLTRWRMRSFHRGSAVDFGLALVALWMFAQVNPSLPMLGNVFISEVAHQPFAAAPYEPFKWLECSAVVLNLLLLGALLLTLLRQRRDAVIALVAVLAVVALVKFVAAALLLKSWALLLWLNSEAMLGLLVGFLLLYLGMGLSHRVTLMLAGAVAAALLFIAFFVLDGNDPASARSIYHWHYGHLLNYNGLSQTIALSFPFLLLGYLWSIRNR